MEQRLETSQKTVMLCKNTIIGKIIRMLYFLQLFGHSIVCICLEKFI